MQITSTSRDGITFVAPAGVIDTRGAQAFETTCVQAFNEGARSFVIDFTRVDLITSAGIRVLVMMGHRLQRGAGGLVLCGISERVRMVFEIGGLLQQFRIAAAEAQAIEMLAAQPKAQSAAKPVQSRLAGLVMDLLGGDPLLRSRRTTGVETSASASALTTTVVALLETGAARGAPTAADRN